jgi:hypothetical protein
MTSPLASELARSPLAATTCDSVEIDAPDGASALDLEHRLRYIAQSEAVRGPGWFVDVSGPVDINVVEVVVRAWLRDIGEASTIVRIDGSEHTLMQEPAAVRKPGILLRR